MSLSQVRGQRGEEGSVLRRHIAGVRVCSCVFVCVRVCMSARACVRACVCRCACVVCM